MHRSISTITLANKYDRIWEKGPFRAKHDFCHFSNSPFQGLKCPRLLAWFISSLDLLLHRSNVWSLSKPVPSGEPPKWGIKRQFSNAIDTCARPTHTGTGRDPRIAASVGWLKNIHARFEVHSYYGSRYTSVLKEYREMVPFLRSCHKFVNLSQASALKFTQKFMFSGVTKQD